jgi:pimeloyl-ACP methyl ester carboxylesterase
MEIPPPRLVSAGDASVAVREWGQRDARPLLFWHSLGAASSGAMLAEVAPTLAAAGLRVASIDAPGFGASPALPLARYGLDALVELATALLDELEVERTIFMGHSWGGAVGVHTSAAAPERIDALILLDSGHIDYAEIIGEEAGKSLDDWITEARERPARWSSWQVFVDELRLGSRRWSPEIEAMLRAALRTEGDEVASITTPEVRGAVMQALARTRQSGAWPALAAAGTPVLLFTATEPPEAAAQNGEWAARFGEAVPQAEIRPVPDAGHSLLTDAGPDVVRSTVEWLTGA